MVAISRYMESSPEPMRIGVSGALSRRPVRPAIGFFLRVSHARAAVESEIITGGFRISVNVLKQARANVELLRSPWGLGSFLAQTKLRDGLLGTLDLALL